MKYTPYKSSRPISKKPKKSVVTREKRPSEKKFAPNILLIICLVITAIAVSIALLLPMINDYREDSLPPVAPMPLGESVTGIYISPAEFFSENMTEDERFVIIERLIDYCVSGGVNTLFCYTKSGESAFYDDRNFEPFFEDFDPLYEISTAASENGIAVVSLLDLYGADAMGYDAAVTHGRYESADEQYSALITESLQRLCRRYPIAGLALYNLSENEANSVYTLIETIAPELAGREVGVFGEEQTGANFADFIISDASNAESHLSLETAPNVYISQGNSTVDEMLFNTYMVAGSPRFSGVIVGEYESVGQDVLEMARTAAIPPADNLIPSYTPKQTLELSEPISGELSTSWATYFIMGFSDPNIPLFMNDVEVVRTGSTGMFGVLVDLELGDNSFVFTQGDTTVSANIERYSYSGGGGGTTHDGTVAVANGNFVEITEPIASALFDPASDGNISETFREGARFMVVDSMTVVRGTQTTYAYQLNSGDWVMTRNTTPVEGDQSVICTGLTLTPSEGGEYLNLDGMNGMVAYDERQGNLLTVTFHGVNFSAAQGVAAQIAETSSFIDTFEIEIDGNITTLSFGLSSEMPVWGHYIEYKDGGMGIEFIAAPPEPTDAPLEGFTVLVDAGHGGEDSGALGVGSGVGVPTEAQLNLTQALSLKIWLEQLGAEVIMSRTDDVTVSLQERLEQSFNEKPHFFLSVHHNSVAETSDGNNSKGVEGYYFEEASQPFAAALTDRVAQYTEREHRGDQYNYFYVTRSTGAMSVLFEYGFVRNPEEYEGLYTEQGILSSTYGTAQGIIDTVEDFYNRHAS